MMFLHPAFFSSRSTSGKKNKYINLKIQSNFGPEYCEIYQMQLPEL